MPCPLVRPTHCFVPKCAYEGTPAQCSKLRRRHWVANRNLHSILRSYDRFRVQPCATGPTAVVATPVTIEGWPLWSLLLASAAAAQAAEEHASWGRLLSAPLLSMLLGGALSYHSIIPMDCPSYDVVWSYLMPMAAACFLLETDLSRLASAGTPLLVSFIIGMLGMICGALVGWSLLHDHLGSEGAKLVACLCASYIGGSVNFAAVAKAVGLSAACIPAAMAADNLAMAVFMAILILASNNGADSAQCNECNRGGSNTIDGSVHTSTAGSVNSSSSNNSNNSNSSSASSSTSAAGPAASCAAPSAANDATHMVNISLYVAAAAVSCAIAQQLALLLNCNILYMMLLAMVAACMSAATNQLLELWSKKRNSNKPSGNLAPPTSPFKGSSKLGVALMQIFFVIIGASAGSLSSLSGCMWLLMFIVVMVTIHWAVLATFGRMLRLPCQMLLLGSNANIGGPATAAGMATAKGWHHLAQPAMMTGSLGYAIGTAAGLAVARLIGA